MVGPNAKSPIAQNKPNPNAGKPSQSPIQAKRLPPPNSPNNAKGPGGPPGGPRPIGNPNQGGPPNSGPGNNQNPMKRGYDGARRGAPAGRGGFRGRGSYQMGPPRSNPPPSNVKPQTQQEDTKPVVKAERKTQPKNMQEEKEMASSETSTGEKKFTGRCRLFVGNLPNDTKEDDFKKMFEQYGELSEVFINSQRGFGFVRLDTRQNAEAAKAALDGLQKKGRVLRVRFATHGAALKVKHLGPFVSNELLEQAFATFGTIERTVVIVDDRGKATGEGIVEFARKPGAQQALTRINEGCFFLGASLRPIMVEPLEQKDEEDGLPEKFLSHNQAYIKEREMSPRFAQRGSFEYEFGMKWKELYRMEEDQRRNLERQIEDQHAKLEMEMGAAQIEHQAKLLHEDYMRKQEELKRMEEMHHKEMQRRLDMRRQEEDMRRSEEERRRQESVIRQQQEEEMRRRQQEGRGRHDGDMYGGPGPNHNDYRGRDEPMPRDMRDRNPPMAPPPAPPAGLGIDRPRSSMGGGMDMGMRDGQGMGPGSMGGPNMGGPNSMGGPGGMNSNNPPQRQSRFDQPPASMGGGGGGGGGFNNMGPGQGMGNRGMGGRNQGMGGNMDGNNGMGGSPMGNNMGNRGGPMNQDRMMERREQRGGDEYFENKRPRRY